MSRGSAASALPKELDLWSDLFFLKWGSPGLCIEEMHTTIFYFIYSTKTGAKPYNNHTN
jgi:hypothetical protein